MKIALSFAILTAMMLALASVSALASPSCAYECEEITSVGGLIYQGDLSNPVADADVEVTCNNNTETTTSGLDGKYKVNFEPEECDYGDTVTVHAEKDSLTGDNSGSIEFTNTYEFCQCCFTLNVGIVNVPLIPEFGIAIGALTMASAIVAFFVIRKNY